MVFSHAKWNRDISAARSNLGESSREMLKEKQLRFLILAARIVSIKLYLGLSGIVLSMLWLGFVHYR